jgi:hypothetical protein
MMRELAERKMRARRTRAGSAEQFMNGLRYLLDGIGRHAGTDLEPGR